MTLPTILVIINNKLKPYATLLGTIGVIIGAIVAVYAFLFRPQDLSVFVQREEVNFPVNINDEFVHVYNFVADSCRDSTVVADTRATYRYLQNTNNFWIITLRNETKKSLKNIVLRITDVSSLGAWAVNSDFLLQSERDKLVKSFTFDSTNSVVALNNIESLPGAEQIKLYIWGKLSTLNLDENLIVTYEDGQGHVGHEYKASGFKAFLCEYLYEFFLLTLLIFFIAYWRLIKKYRHVTP